MGTSELLERLRGLGMRTMAAAPLRAGMVGLAFHDASDADRFVDLVARSSDDALTCRMWAHPSTGWEGQEWQYEASAIPVDADAAETRNLYVNVPGSDAPEVLARLASQ